MINLVELKEVHRNIILSLIIAIVTLFIGLIISCAIVYFLPGDPVLEMQMWLSPADIVRITDSWGLNEPWILRLGKYIIKFFSGDWDVSYAVLTGTPVTEIVFILIPRTLEIILLPLILGLILGILLARLSRKFQEHKIGRIIKIFITVGIAIPAFLFALIFQLAFMEVLPIVGIHSPALQPSPQVTGFMLIDSLIDGNMELAGDILLHYILPCLSFTIIITALVARQLRSNLEINSLTRSVISNTTTIGINFGLIFTSIILLETTFNLRGFGYYFLYSIFTRDLFLLTAFLNLIIVLFVITTFIANIIYSIRKPKEFVSFKEIEPKLRWKSPITIIGLIIVGFIVIVAISPELISSYSFQETIGVYPGAFEPPSSEHPLGQGGFGRDILAMITWGMQDSLLTSLGAVIIGLGGGALFGLIAGRLNELGKNILSGVMLILYIIPSLILVFLITFVFGANFILSMVIIGIVLIPSFTRIISNAMFLEIDVLKSIVKYIPLQIGIAIILYNSIGFLGFSDFSIINLGDVVSRGRANLFGYFGAALFPGIAIALMAGGFILLYEGL